MAERFPGDGAAANGFGRRHLHEWEALLLHECEYPAPPDMRVPGLWKLSAGGVPVPPPPTGGERRGEIVRIRASLPEESRRLPKYASDNHRLWDAYFQRRHAEQIASTNGVVAPRGRLNFDGRRRWWGVPGRTLHAVLEYIEGGNVPPLEYRPATAGSWLPRRMASASSSSSGSGSRSGGTLTTLLRVKEEGSHSGGTPTSLVRVKEEPLETERRRTRSSGIVREAASTPPRGHLCLVRPKLEPGTAPPAVAQEHVAMAADLKDGLKWARDDYMREEVERQCRALEEIAERRRGREVGGVILLDSNDEEEAAAGPSNPGGYGDAGKGCSGHGDDDDGGDYTAFYRLLGME